MYCITFSQLGNFYIKTLKEPGADTFLRKFISLPSARNREQTFTGVK